MTTDAGQPLPGAPDPWAPSAMPAWRDGPPYAMTEMIEAEPAVAGRVTRRLQAEPALRRLAGAILEAANSGRAIVATGCGTSHHAAIAIAALIADGLARAGRPDDHVHAVQAFELAGRLPGRGGLVIAVSHEGGTAATNDTLRKAGEQGLVTAVITVSDRSPAARLAGHVLATGEQDQSWCHTVGYLSPLVTGACLHATIRGTELDPAAVERQVAAGSDPVTAERLASGLAGIDRLLVVGSGADHAAARELALKVEEGVHLPAVAHELETIRHGHLAAANARTGLAAVLTDAEGRGAELRNRIGGVLASAAALGMPSVMIGPAAVAEGIGDASVSRYVVPLADDLPRRVAAVLGVAVPLQLLTERLARARGTNPDTIGRDDPAQAAAASA